MTADIKFAPVQTVQDLETLEPLSDMKEGYYAGLRGDDEPGHNHGRAYWHGWRNGMMDSHRMEIDAAARRLAHQVR